MIPKVIHYIWFGRNPKSEIIQRCMESWRKYCPDWEIVEWNEDNFEVRSNSYMREAYDAKKWAFASDVARLQVLYEHGGVYMDTDVELKGPIDSWLDQDAFFVFENGRNIASGLGFGCVKGSPAVKAMLEMYENRHFIRNGKPDLAPCPAINTEAIVKACPEIKRNGTSQAVNGIRIVSPEEYAQKAVHQYTGTWIVQPTADDSTVRKQYRDTWLKRFVRQEKIFTFLEGHCGKKIVRIYTLFAYDLLENGPMYYIKRSLRKRK